jgi:hypothetical protein
MTTPAILQLPPGILTQIMSCREFSSRTYSQRIGFHPAYNEAHLRLRLVYRVFYDTLASIIFKTLSIQTCKLSLAWLKSIAEEPRVNHLVREYNFGLSHVYDLGNKDL